jgi:hypothetical protein
MGKVGGTQCGFHRYNTLLKRAEETTNCPVSNKIHPSTLIPTSDFFPLLLPPSALPSARICRILFYFGKQVVLSSHFPAGLSYANHPPGDREDKRPPTPKKATDQPDSAPEDSDEKLTQLPTEAPEEVLKPLHGTNAGE